MRVRRPCLWCARSHLDQRAVKRRAGIGAPLQFVGRVAEELGRYYELVYAPVNPNLVGRFRHVSAKVSRPGVRLRSRAGYFATLGAEVMRILQQNHVRVPEDISLICFDDLDWFSFSNPPISAIATSYQRLAEAAIELLQRRIESVADSDMPPVEIRIGFELVVRRSTAALG